VTIPPPPTWLQWYPILWVLAFCVRGAIREARQVRAERKARAFERALFSIAMKSKTWTTDTRFARETVARDSTPCQL
jgi:hypothetical protein